MTKLENLYAKPTEWENYGDVNPERYGGLFVKWDKGMWHLIETTHYADLPKFLSENEHMFSHMYIEPQDVWKNGNPYKGFTDRMLKELKSFSNLPFVPFNPENADKNMPKDESYTDYVEWYLSEHTNRLMGLVCHSIRGYADPTNDFSTDYWSYLESYDIEQ